MMWFKALSMLIAIALIGKATIALLWSARFYTVRKRQYASERMPATLWVAPVIVLCLTAFAWYATFAHHRPWCWVVPAFLTLLSGMSLDHLLRWDTHRARMLRLINRPGLWRIDCALFVLGCGFAALAVFVY